MFNMFEIMSKNGCYPNHQIFRMTLATPLGRVMVALFWDEGPRRYALILVFRRLG